MKVLVSDSSVIIDLCRYRLIQPLGQLPYDFCITDITLAEILRDDHRSDLLGTGIRVVSLTSEEMGLLMRFQTENKGLSNADCSSLAIMKSRKYALLAGDRIMRRTAKDGGFEVHGTLWIIDAYLDHNLVTPKTIRSTLELMLEDPRIRLPRSEMHRRIKGLR